MKKIVAIVMALSVLGSASACALPVPTAESLLERNLGGDGKNKSGELSMEMNIEMPLNSPEDPDTIVDMGMQLEMDMAYTEDVVNIEGGLLIEMMGVSVKRELEQWIDVDGDEQTVYSKLEDADGWTKEEKEFSGVGITTLKADMFKDLVLDSSNKEKYVVTGVIDYEDMTDSLALNMDEFTASASDELEDLAFDVIFTFDKKTKALEKVTMSVQEDSVSSLDKFTIEMEIESMGEDLDLEIPDKVKDNVVSEDKGSGTLDMGESVAGELTQESVDATESSTESDEDTVEEAVIDGTDTESVIEDEQATNSVDDTAMNTQDNSDSEELKEVESVSVSSGSNDDNGFKIATQHYNDSELILIKNCTGASVAGEVDIVYYLDNDVVGTDTQYLNGLADGGSQVVWSWPDYEYDRYEVVTRPEEPSTKPVTVGVEEVSANGNSVTLRFTNEYSEEVFIEGIQVIAYKNESIVGYEIPICDSIPAGEYRDVTVDVYTDNGFDYYEAVVQAVIIQ